MAFHKAVVMDVFVNLYYIFNTYYIQYLKVNRMHPFLHAFSLAVNVKGCSINFECTICHACMCTFCLCHEIIFSELMYLIYLFGVLYCFQHCSGHFTMGSFASRRNQYIQLSRFCIVNCLPSVSNHKLSNIRSGVQGRAQR